MKYKLSHKRADKATWSASDGAQRKRLIQILKTMISDLEQGVAETPASAEARASKARLPRRAVREGKENKAVKERPLEAA